MQHEITNGKYSKIYFSEITSQMALQFGDNYACVVSSTFIYVDQRHNEAPGCFRFLGCAASVSVIYRPMCQ